MTIIGDAPSLADLLTLAQAARRVPGKPHPKTVLRWMLRGLDGVRLKSVRAGRQRLTCERWLVEFFAASAKVHAGGIPTSAAPTAAPATPARTSERSARTARVLREAGVRR